MDDGAEVVVVVVAIEGVWTCLRGPYKAAVAAAPAAAPPAATRAKVNFDIVDVSLKEFLQEQTLPLNTRILKYRTNGQEQIADKPRFQHAPTTKYLDVA